MRRAFVGLLRARIRPERGVRTAAAAASLLVLAACGAADRTPAAFSGPLGTATTAAPATTAPATTAPATTAPASTPSPAVSPAPAKVVVPAVVGMSASRAAGALTRLGLRVRTTIRRTSRYAQGVVAAASPPAATALSPGSTVTLAIAQPPPAATRPPAPKPAPSSASTSCDPAYPDVCLKDGIGDYDCSSGSGNGPNYVRGPVRVLPPDPFGLDADGDGVGCEKG
ncbi:MAG: PASTA domain-containing protein [Mycobacteriales bacterium]